MAQILARDGPFESKEVRIDHGITIGWILKKWYDFYYVERPATNPDLALVNNVFRDVFIDSL